MKPTTFDGSALLLQDDLLHSQGSHDDDGPPGPLEIDHLAWSIRQGFAATDQEGALLVIEIDESDDLDADDRSMLLDHVAQIARTSIRRSDILDKIDERTLAIGLPGSGRIGMTRVADAIRQRVQASALDENEGAGAVLTMSTTVTIGAVHTTEARLVNLDDLLLAARVNLDAARAAGRNRTNWSDWSSIPS